MQPRCLAPAQVSTEPSVTTHRQGPQQSAPQPRLQQDGPSRPSGGCPDAALTAARSTLRCCLEAALGLISASNNWVSVFLEHFHLS